MSIKILNHKEATALINDVQHVSPPVWKSFYDVFGSAGCLLNCEDEKNLNESPQYERTNSNLHSRAERKLVRSARKAQLKKFQGSLQEWFTDNEITTSAGHGCGSCRVLNRSFKALSLAMSKVAVNMSTLLPKISKSNDALKAKKTMSQSFSYSNLQACGHQLECAIREAFPVRFPLWWRCIDLTAARLDRRMHDDSRPTRLLDLTPIERDGESGIRLIETASRSSYQYACLSHRWDIAPKHPPTTAENLLEFLDFINLKQLPTNFLDAISIARGLNIQYLWIDSLCIIQRGNKDDLQRELAKMGSIYQNAHLTIATVSSPDSSQGCFINNQWPDVCLLVSNSTNEAHLMGVRVLDEKGSPISTTDVTEHYPLLNRAWVFQERLLSTRLLQCNYGEFEFQCLESSRCECNSSLAPHLGRQSQWARYLNFTRQRHFIVQGAENVVLKGSADSWKHHALKYWKTIVVIYMQLELSYTEDVLPAIAGCAQILVPHLKFTYVAGMWKETLSTDLLWYVTPLPHKKQAVPKPRPKDSTAPSWSWASVSMGQTIKHTDWQATKPWSTSDALLRDAIKEVHCTPESTTNPFGKLRDVYLRLDAVLYPWYLHFFCQVYKLGMVSAYRRATKDLYITRARSNHSLRCTTEIPELDIDGATVELRLDVRLKEEDIVVESFSHCISNPSQRCALAQVYLLHALHKEGTSNEGTSSAFDVFLVLKRSSPTDGKPNCYRRIGLINMMKEGDNIRSWDSMIRGRLEPQREEFWLF